MSPVTGPMSGSFLVFTGEDAETLREVLRLYLAETMWTVTYPDFAADEAEVHARRRAVCEQATRSTP
jgi:hypothetical protein